jgi:hypothetical protein
MGSTNSCLLLSYVGRIVRGGTFCVNWAACASRRKSLQNFLTFSAQCCSPRAALKNVPRCARRASKFCLWIQGSAADCGVHRLEFELKKSRGAACCAPVEKIPAFANCYASFSTATLICAVTSRNTLMVTGNSPMVLSGSPSCAWRLSILKPCAASASAISAEVTEPNI